MIYLYYSHLIWCTTFQFHHSAIAPGLVLSGCILQSPVNPRNHDSCTGQITLCHQLSKTWKKENTTKQIYLLDFWVHIIIPIIWGHPCNNYIYSLQTTSVSHWLSKLYIFIYEFSLLYPPSLTTWRVPLPSYHPSPATGTLVVSKMPGLSRHSLTSLSWRFWKLHHVKVPPPEKTPEKNGTNSGTPWKGGPFQRKWIILQPSIFRGMFVSFQGGVYQKCRVWKELQ